MTTTCCTSAAGAKDGGIAGFWDRAPGATSNAETTNRPRRTVASIIRGISQMTLGVGVRLGPYEVISPIGAGGMGEVYKATDTRLNRTVALKVLPPHFADDPEMKQRFEREAQTIAGLNHPNICMLHDVGQDAGRSYLVMEFVEGETLASRLARGPLAIDDALRVAGELADALDKANRQGVI